MEVSSVLVMSSASSLFLRKTTILVFPPAFILCLIHGIISGIAVPALGLIPLFGSAILGSFLMYRDQITFSGSPISLTRAHVCACDFLLGVVLLIILIISWIVVTDSWDRGAIMLGTYATVPLMMNWWGYTSCIEIFD